MTETNKKLPLRRILVPLTGSETDDETIRMACWLAKRDKSKLYVIYIITIKRALPLEAAIESETKIAEELLEKAEKIAEQEEYQVETDLLQAREVPPTIVEQARERKIDLILMGIKNQRRFGQFSLENLVTYVLKNATCQVMLYSQYNQPIPA